RLAKAGVDSWPKERRAIVTDILKVGRACNREDRLVVGLIPERPHVQRREFLVGCDSAQGCQKDASIHSSSSSSSSCGDMGGAAHRFSRFNSFIAKFWK